MKYYQKKFFVLRLLILSVFILLISILANAQSEQFSLLGKVKDGAKGEFLFGASVYLRKVGDSSLVMKVITDTSGKFFFSNIKAGNYFLQCIFSGFKPYYSSGLSIGGYLINKKDITLFPSQVDLDPVIVEKKRTITFDGNKIIINPKSMAGATTGTALDLLKSMPGIMIDPDESITLNGRSDVTILINDRKRTLSMAQAVRILKTIPSSSVKQVEISNGKSAANDAAGAAGTINIVTNRSLGDGYNFEFYNGVTVDNYVSQSNNATLNLQRKKVDIYASAGYSRSYGYGNFDAMGTYNKKTMVATFTSDVGNNYSLSRSPFFDGSVDWKINKNHVIGVAGSSYFGKINSENELRSLVSGSQNFITENVSNSIDKDNLTSIDILYNYTSDSNRTKLKADFGYLTGYSIVKPQFSNKYFDGLGQILVGPINIDANIPLDGYQYIGQVDLDHRFNKRTAIQFGIKFSAGTVSNDVRYDTVRNGKLYNDPLRTEKFKYDEIISAAYLSLKQNLFKKITSTLGLRYENTFMGNTAYNPFKTSARSFENLFPSATITYNGKSIRTSLNYNRSIVRPYYGYLNPYIKYVNEFTYQVGNADLTPAFSNTLILTNAIKDFIFLNVGYYGVTDNIMLYRQQVQNTTNTIIKPENAYDYNALYSSLTVNFSALKSKWEGSLNFYGFSYRSKLKPGFNITQFDSSRMGRFVMTTSQSFKFSKKFSVEAQYSYYGKNRVNQVEIGSRWQLGAGLRYKAFSDKCTISMYVSDIFYTMPEQRFRFYDSFESITNSRVNSRRITLSVSFSIGKLTQTFDKNTSTQRQVSRYKENKD